MASFKKKDKMPVQGGFILFKPNIQDYDNIINIIMNTEFHKGRGWNRSEIGWFWGGMTIQGELPYYYNRVTTPNRSLIIDRCKYNTMADTAECTDTLNGTRNTLTNDQIVSAHFTVCQKPWGCWAKYYQREQQDFNYPLCLQLHLKWLELRAETELFYGLTQYNNACLLNGKNKYIQMDFKFPNQWDVYSQSALTFNGKSYPSILRRDNSPDVLLPRPGSGFI